MVKQALIYSSFLLLLASCSSLKPLVSSDKKQQEQPPAPPIAVKKEVKFLDNINTGIETGPRTQEQNDEKKEVMSTNVYTRDEYPALRNSEIEKTSSLQVKYSLLLNTEVENVQNLKMFEFIDEWYGTRYHLGGTTKKGIDCSAFTQLLFSSVYGISLARTARDQYRNSSRISRTHLQQGDLLFFNTRGGVSHVGVYLQNNKFVHASTSGGVTISDLYDPYWLRRFVGVGRLNTEPGVVKQ